MPARRLLSRLGALACALLACAALPAAAHAAIAVERLSLTPADNRAGVHTRVDLHAEFSTGDALRGMVVHLPPGVVGDPQSRARCPQRQFDASTCPLNTRVGVATVTTSLPLVGTASGGVFNLEPGPGEPARLGVAVTPAAPVGTTKMVVRAALRPDGGIDTILQDIPADGGAVRSVDLSLGGQYAPLFMRLPTSCGPATTTVEATSAGGARGSASTTFTPLQCDRLTFAPSLAAGLDRRGPAAARNKPALRTEVLVPRGDAGIRHLRVTLPARIGLDLSRPLPVCTLEDVRAETCPDSTRIGTVSAVTPVLATPLTGIVHMTAVEGALLPGVRLSLGGPVQLRLQGAMDLSTGITADFDGLPDLPLDRLALTFSAGGPLKVLGDPCTGTPLRMDVAATGHNGAAIAAPARVRMRGCPPLVTLALSRGHRPRLRLSVRRGRDAAKVRRVVVRLPLGLHGVTKRAGAVRVRGRTVVFQPRSPRARIDVALRRGALRGRPHGPFRVEATTASGRRFGVRVKAAALR